MSDEDQGRRSDETPVEPTEAGAATSGWVTPGDQSQTGRSSLSRWPVIVAAWVIAAIALVIAGRGAQMTHGVDTGYAYGYGLGTALVPIAFGLAAAAIVGAVRDRRVGPSTFRTALVPLVAIGFAAALIVGQAPAPIPLGDPANALRISGPYTIVDADAATTKTLQASLASQDSVRSSVVRLIKGNDGSVTALVVADMAISPDTDFAEFRRGLEDGAGHPAVLETIAGRQVAFVSTATGSGAVWLEPPLSLFVFGVDAPTTRAIVEAILNAP